MPKPEWVERRNNLRQAMRLIEDLFEDDNCAEALDAVDDSDDDATRARNNAMGYFREKGVRIPPGLAILEVTRESPFSVTVQFDGLKITVKS